MEGATPDKQLEAALLALHEKSKIATFVSRSATPVNNSGLPTLDLLFARFKEDSPDIDALAEFLSSQVVNYVVPLKRRRAAMALALQSDGGADLSVVERLVKEAKSKFIELNSKYPSRASELGELLAYLVALEWLGAFQLASKMALKTSYNMPVHGLDGIHAKFDAGVMTLYFLESKVAKDAQKGMREYCKSIQAFGGNKKQYLLEYAIIGDLSNLDVLDEIDRKLALEYLDVYGDKKSVRLERSVGIVCYSEPLFSNKLPKSASTPPQQHEDHFAAFFGAEHAEFQKKFKNALANANLGDDAGSVWLVAVPDKDELRKLFYQGIGS